jgi:mRNA-degrading endonuclease YafQ of YafQ-DinJ toxin-antitoxin module
MRQIELTHSYLKDLHLIRRRQLPENELNEVIYKKEDTKQITLLYLMRTGTHSDLF